MGKDDDDALTGLGIIAGILAGAWLLGKALSSKKVEYFRCWNCNNLIVPNTNPCPYCRSHIDWGMTNQSV
jgi:hypothetical protein